MAKRYGYAGKILRVDLSAGNIWTEPTEKHARRFVGGRAVNTWILLNELSPDVGWSDPENMIAFGPGMLVGTLAPGAGRTSVDTTNAFNDSMGSSNVGGFFGAELRFAGFDHVVIRGRAEEPVYLWMCDGEAEVRDASPMWGETTWETERAIREEIGDKRVRVAAIGPAGENLVRAAGIMFDRGHSAGGSGVGAVMGSKNLKALAARGSRPIEIANPKRFMEVVDDVLRKVDRSYRIEEIRAKGVYGAVGGVEGEAPWLEGFRPVRNGQDDYWDPEKIAKVGATAMGKYRKKTFSCFSCPRSCYVWNEIREGPYKIRGEGFWNQSANAFCANFDQDNPEAAVYAHLLVSQLGMDLSNGTQPIAWAFEAYEKGLITKKDTDGLELTWGNHKSMTSMIKKVAMREGFGDFLADGVVMAAKKLGKDSEKFAIHMKGQDAKDGYRVNKAWSFGLATSTVSGRHLRGATDNILRRRLEENFDRPANSYENVPEDCYVQEQRKAVRDITGVCTMNHSLTIDDSAALASAATGRKISTDKFMKIGLQAHNLEKAFNTLHAGFTRKDDHPCYRYYNEPVRSGPYKGERIIHDVWERMLDRYYELHGWDKETSWQTNACLERLDLRDVAERLRKAGRLK